MIEYIHTHKDIFLNKTLISHTYTYHVAEYTYVYAKVSYTIKIIISMHKAQSLNTCLHMLMY
ncbi:hypothetical protein F383_35317 [Gossypium arboreum]|uniref:Uncharacterized protein n=1 Tax=Gossypium arboreum TaxID=29729 RepID=A0A0B0PPP5_GOSAR|nr:hypothetical protein F383_35317 [Gossypium arboreum]